MKKIMIWQISLALLLSLFLIQPSVTEASTTYSGVVNTDLLNVRAKASSSSEKVGSIKKGTKVTVYVKNKNGWATIQHNGKKRYVSAKYLNYSENVKFKELQTLKAAAIKGTTPHSEKIKLGDNPQAVINKYGSEFEGWGMREYYVLEYPKFAAMYGGMSDGTGEYPLFDNETEIYNISSQLNRGYTVSEIRKVFGNKFAHGYDYIPMEDFIIFQVGKYKVYFMAPSSGPDEDINWKTAKFQQYSVVDF